MAEQIIQWEYRVLTVGSALKGAKDEQIEAALNELGMDGWEAVNVYAQTGSSKVTLVAKRHLTAASRRMRSMPQNY